MTRTAAHGLMLTIVSALLSGCSGSPTALGITGPNGPNVAAPGPPPASDDAAIPPPGDPSDFGTRYSPSVAPTFGSDGRFYGYN